MRKHRHFVGFILPCMMLAFIISASVSIGFNVKKSLAEATPDIAIIKLAKINNRINIPAVNTALKFGVYLNTATSPKSVETELANKLNIMAWFTTWKSGLASNKLKYACQYGYVPTVTWESWTGKSTVGNPYPLADIASGKFDDLIKNQLTAVKQICGHQTVIIRFDHEMDSDPGEEAWYPWQKDSANYILAWRHIVDMSHKIDSNIKWMWSPNRGNQYTAEYYPGANWVDYTGITLNHSSFDIYDVPTFRSFYLENQAVLESFNKPIIIAETGVAESYDSNQKAEWVNGMFDYAKQNPQITAIISLDFQQVYASGQHSDYRLDSSATSLKAYSQSLTELRRK